MKTFYASFGVTFVGMALAFFIGFQQGGMSMALTLLLSAFALAVLEIAVSLDNAVVNARYLDKLNDRSRRWFLTWGMVIAVFGMRALFPVAIVSVAAGINPFQALSIALFDPETYHHHIEAAHIGIMGFGMGFLMMLTISYMFDHEKDVHWVPGIEKVAAYMAKFPHVQLLIAMPIMIAASVNQTMLLSGLFGILTFYLVHGLKEMLEEMEHEKEAQLVGMATKPGLMIGPLLFLEVLDASFSFDGVLSAYAITNNFLIIVIGLAIGAMYVRSVTIYLVERRTLAAFPHLEPAAMWGIAWLVTTMGLSAHHIELGEIVVAYGAALIIVLGLITSTIHNKRNAAALA